MPGIGVINNPRSRQNKRHPERIGRLSYMLGQSGSSRETWTFDELDEVMAEFKRREIDILAINGGDGSNHVTLSSMIKIYGDAPLPKIALLRGGTLNTVSNACKIKGTTEWLLYNLQEKYANGLPFETIERNLMRIGDYHGFLFGNGLIANFMDTYYETGTPSAVQGGKVLLRGVFSAIFRTPLAKAWFAPVRAKVTIDDSEVLPYDAFATMAIGSIHEIGLGFTTWPRCVAEPDRLHALFLLGSPFAIVRDLPYIWLGRPMHPRFCEERVPRRVRIEAQHSFKYTIDGDMHDCVDGRLIVECGPRLTIIRK